MKRALLGLLLLSTALFSNAQDSLNMKRLSTWTSPSANFYNDIWGYTAGGREYAIMGSNWGTHFIDVTNPSAPVEINSFMGRNNNVVWRDYKVVGHYAYGVADNFGNSLQIFDLSNLPNSVTMVYDEDSLSESTHNIYIEGNYAYMSSNRRNGSIVPLEILDLTNPTDPKLVASLDNTYFGGCWGCLHDIYVKDGIAYCSAGTSGIYIYDLTDPQNPVHLNDITLYTDQGYNHASWANEIGDLLVFADETHNTALKIYSMKNNYQDLLELDTFKTVQGAIPHNPFIVGDEVYISYYHDGMQVYNISEPTTVKRTAFYDTYPNNAPNDHGGYEGDWGVYPFFESKNIIASDITYGLNVLRKVHDVYTNAKTMNVCPGQTKDVDFSIEGSFEPANEFYIELSDIGGWYMNPDTLAVQAGNTAGTISVTFPTTLQLDSIYKIRMTSSEPALMQGDYTLLNVTTCTSTMVDEVEKPDIFKVFPNPSNGTFSIMNLNQLNANVQIFNAQGTMVAQKIASSSMKFELASGMYTVKIVHDEGTEIERLIIE